MLSWVVVNDLLINVASLNFQFNCALLYLQVYPYASASNNFNISVEKQLKKADPDAY